MTHTTELSNTCKTFTSSLETFKSKVVEVVDSLVINSKKIDNQKLRNVGIRGYLEGEVEERQRKQLLLGSSILEKRREFERLEETFRSLEKVEQEQTLLIEKLQNQ